MAREESADLPAVFLIEDGARYISDTPAGLYQRHGPVQNFGLLFLAMFNGPRPHPPFGIWIAPPGAGTSTRRINQYKILASHQIVISPADRFWRAHLYVARTRSFQSAMDGGEPPLVIVGGKNLTLVLHHRCHRQG